MLLSRLLSIALCAVVAACAVAVVHAFPPARGCQLRARAAGTRAGAAACADRAMGATPVSVVDVAPGVPPARIAALIQLAPGEHVSAVNDRAPASDLEVGAVIASRSRRGEFVDLTVAGRAGERRVLVLLH